MEFNIHFCCFLYKQAPNPLYQNCWSSHVLMEGWSAFLWKYQPSMSGLAPSFWMTEMDQEWRLWPTNIWMMLSESTQKSSRSGWLEEASSQWTGPHLWRSYMTLNSPPSLVISTPVSVLLNSELHAWKHTNINHFFNVLVCIVSWVLFIHISCSVIFINSVFITIKHFIFVLFPLCCTVYCW